jgi:eukaryotic-like serine/threonine-protein kinase
MDLETTRESVALAFLERFLDDRTNGRKLDLTHYLALFPGHERVIAEEYLNLDSARTSSPETSWNETGTLRAGASLGPYTLKSVIGEGGQGTVWLAEDSRLRRVVAIKLLRKFGSDAEERMRRFRTETETASRLYHPGICVVHDVGITHGVP